MASPGLGVPGQPQEPVDEGHDIGLLRNLGLGGRPGVTALGLETEQAVVALLLQQDRAKEGYRA